MLAAVGLAAVWQWADNYELEEVGADIGILKDRVPKA